MTYSESSIYNIQLPVFQGPIELLYQLIQKNELDITEVSLALITDEYLQYIHSNKSLTKDSLYSFLEIASHLIYLKSKSLLPLSHILEDDPTNEEGAYTDMLLERILFFSRLEKGIDFLQKRFLTWNYSRSESTYAATVRGEYSLAQISLYQLVELTLPWLQETKEHSLSRGEIRPLYLGVEERWQWILAELNGQKKALFFGLIAPLSVVDQIISFLTLLEKAKQQVLKIEQEYLFTDIAMEFIYG